MAELIYRVASVAARLEGNEIEVTAHGETRTSGWKNPRLVEADRNGDTLVFEFVADPPDGISNEVITPVQATVRTGPQLPPFPTSVTVRAETNEESAPVIAGDQPRPSKSGPYASA